MWMNVDLNPGLLTLDFMLLLLRLSSLKNSTLFWWLNQQAALEEKWVVLSCYHPEWVTELQMPGSDQETGLAHQLGDRWQRYNVYRGMTTACPWTRGILKSELRSRPLFKNHLCSIPIIHRPCWLKKNAQPRSCALYFIQGHYWGL